MLALSVDFCVTMGETVVSTGTTDSSGPSNIDDHIAEPESAMLEEFDGKGNDHIEENDELQSGAAGDSDSCASDATSKEAKT